MTGAAKRKTCKVSNVDPQRAQLLERLRDELMRELNFDGLAEGYFGAETTARCGKLGQLLQMRARQLLKNEHMPEIRHKRP